MRENDSRDKEDQKDAHIDTKSPALRDLQTK